MRDSSCKAEEIPQPQNIARTASIVCYRLPILAVSAWTLQCPGLHETRPPGDAHLTSRCLCVLTAVAAGVEIDLAIS